MDPRGRKPKPTALKILEGNPGKRPLNGEEPRFAECVDPQPVAKLSGRAKKLWQRRVTALGASRIIRETDLPLLTSLVQVEARVVEWGEQLDNDGPMGNDGASENPLAKMVDRQIELQAKLCRVFGFTPADRSTLKELATGEADALTEALMRAS